MKEQYENRICCFIDILGFKEHVNQTIVNGDEVEEKIVAIKNILREANDLVKFNETDKFKLSKKVTQFSDCIVISFKAEEATEILLTLSYIMHLCISGVCYGFLLRGAITYDRLLHTDDYIFGPAIINAYAIESTAAIYPRIVLDKSILELAKENREKEHTSEEVEEYLNNFLTKDFDDMYYIDYISKAETEFDNPTVDFKIYIENFKKIITQNDNAKNHSIKIKYGWLKTKLNVLINICRNNLEVIESLENKGDSELANYYKELKSFD